MASPRCTATPPSALIARPAGKTCMGSIAHACTSTHIPPSEHKCWITVSPIVVPAVVMLLESLWTPSIAPSELGGSVLSCMRKRLEQLVTQRKKSRCRRQGRAQLTPRSGLVRRICRRRPPSSSHASDPSMRGLVMPPHYGALRHEYPTTSCAPRILIVACHDFPHPTPAVADASTDCMLPCGCCPELPPMHCV